MVKFCVLCGKIVEGGTTHCGGLPTYPNTPLVRQWYATLQLEKALKLAYYAAWTALEADPAYPPWGSKARSDFVETYMAPYKALLTKCERDALTLADHVAAALTATTE